MKSEDISMNISRKYSILKPSRNQKKAPAPVNKADAPVRLSEEDRVFLEAAKWTAKHAGRAYLD